MEQEPKIEQKKLTPEEEQKLREKSEPLSEEEGREIMPKGPYMRRPSALTERLEGTKE